MATTAHPVLTAPKNENVPVWRYMDFTKFVSMLANKGVFFSRLDKLGDQFEGALPRFNLEHVDSLPPALAKDDFFVMRLHKSKERSRRLTRDLRSIVFVSAWHMSERESAGMWKLYARTEEAICIRSTYAKLVAEFPEDVYLSAVNYIDYEQDAITSGNLLAPYCYKLKSFEHEQELRAFVADLTQINATPEGWTITPLPEYSMPGCWRSVDLAQMIDSVYIAPTAPEWFRETVDTTIKQFGFAFPPAIRSDLDKSPLW